ncbi:hypothetical protein SAMN05660477_00761 [Soonwooa buanensis]|uniref:IPExxxVDY family protein n=1 Tax=Soonwooa buanensis TaxID=619805 RepID=A0A1T5DIS1_9FLAO|nr:IPExxxVDY family protein [Soonwooa buanensis]SKB71501.1 hypothetical protein SAMN05660477_00761 [Soonwooa buanensis]
MKSKKLFLDFEEEECIDVGLVRIASNLPHFEVFFHLNNSNTFNLKRSEDIVFEGVYNDYFFECYEAYDKSNKNCWKLISNKSISTIFKKEQSQLFQDEEDVKFLLNDHHDVDYIVKSSDSFADFSVILLPEKLFFPIQEFELSADTELYQIIQYYE